MIARPDTAPADGDEQQATAETDGEHAPAVAAAEQQRPAELTLGGEDEEEPEPPPLAEVRRCDGEVNERGAGGARRSER